MEFNFGSFTNVQATSSVQPRLKPWEIHKVKFSGARVRKIPRKLIQFLKPVLMEKMDIMKNLFSSLPMTN